MQKSDVAHNVDMTAYGREEYGFASPEGCGVAETVDEHCFAPCRYQYDEAVGVGGIDMA